MPSMANPLLGCVYLQIEVPQVFNLQDYSTAASILDNEKVTENHRFFS